MILRIAAFGIAVGRPLRQLAPLLKSPRRYAATVLASKVAPGLRWNEHIEGDGEAIFRHACKLGLEGIVSKRKDSPYRSGRSPDWRSFPIDRPCQRPAAFGSGSQRPPAPLLGRPWKPPPSSQPVA